jgi:Brp/Blh family beta-carotene 15,15'-monooxygenase
MKTWTLLYGIPWLVLSGTILFATSTDEATETVGAWVLLASVLLIGLPHGACDFQLLKKDDSEPRSLKNFSKVLTLYTLLAAVIAVLWFVLPEISLTAFLILTAWHFGSGDEVWSSSGSVARVPAWVRGLMIVSAPLAFHRDDSAAVLNALVRSSDSPFVDLILDIAIYVFMASALVLVIYESHRAFRFKSLEPARIIEPVLIGTFFYLVSPLLAVAIYFVAVHSWRHVFRLELYDRPGSEVGEKGVIGSFVAFYRKALPITALSLIGLVLIFIAFRSDLSYLSQWTSSYLILLSALTVPHAILIRKMEKGLAEPLS